MRPQRVIIFLLVYVVLLVPAPKARAQAEPPRLPEKQEWAIGIIKEGGGYVFRKSQLPGQPVTAIVLSVENEVELNKLQVFPFLEELDLSGVTDEGLARLPRLTRLKYLGIQGDQITGAGLVHLKGLPGLQSLALTGKQISDANLIHLKRLPNLQHLTLNEVALKEDGFVNLRQLTTLEELEIRYPPKKVKGLLRLKGMPRLRTLLLLLHEELKDPELGKLKTALPYTLICSRTSPVLACVERPPIADTSLKEAWNNVLRLGIAFILAMGVVVVGLLFFRIGPTWIIKLVVVSGFILLVGFTLLQLAPSHFPVRHGKPAEFWLEACRIDLGATSPRPGYGYYHYKDGWFYYEDLVNWRISEAEAEAYLPRVLERLQQAPPGALNPHVEAGYRRWLATNSDPRDSVAFVDVLQKTRLERLEKEGPDWVFNMFRRDQSGWDRYADFLKNYSNNLLFEFLFFSCLILFAAWPWLRGSGPFGWAVHLGLLPVLFVLPYWLGYNVLAFYRNAWVGGILYPDLLLWLRNLPWQGLDTTIVRNLPQILDPLFPFFWEDRFKYLDDKKAGPVAVVNLSMMIGLATFVIATVLHPLWRRELMQTLSTLPKRMKTGIARLNRAVDTIISQRVSWCLLIAICLAAIGWTGGFLFFTLLGWNEKQFWTRGVGAGLASAGGFVLGLVVTSCCWRLLPGGKRTPERLR